MKNKTIDLDNINYIKKLDTDDVYESILFYPKQIEHAWEDRDSIKVPDKYSGNYKAIVFCGMGGSGLGGRFIKSVYGESLNIPIFTVNDYKLPKWVDKNTLVICSSFSGTTEETLSNFKEGLRLKSKVMSIGSGGELIKMSKDEGVPFYQINPVYNPAKHPRLAICYSIVGQLMLLEKAGIKIIDESEIKLAVKVMEDVIAKTNIDIKEKSNPAKTVARKISKSVVIFVASRHLVGSVHTIKNQLNENAKNFADIFEIPELNHHLLEGLMFPEDNRKNISFFFCESDLYGERILKRYQITKNILDKYDIKHETYKTKSKTVLLQAFETIQFGGFLNYYLGILNDVNPGPIPWVDYFKKNLGQSLGQWK